MTDKILEVRGLTKTYGGEKKPGAKQPTPTLDVLKGIDIDIYRGDVVCLIGPSGCGKSTFLRCLNRLEIPSSGSIKFEGTEVDEAHIDAVRQKMGMVFQHFNLFPHLTVKKNLELAPTLLKLKDKQAISDKADELLARVGLSDKADAYPKSLSGGQQQRIAIARAIVNEPEILLLDEPLGALDLKMRKEMQLELMAMHKELGITFIYVTHDQEEALTMSDKVVVMSDGKIQQIGTPEEIYNEPHTVFVADFIGESNIYTGHMCGICEVDFCGAKFACLDDLPVGAKVDVIVRPEDVIMTAPEDGTITGVVQSVIFKGMHYEIIVESGDNEVVIQSTRSAKEGDTIGMCLEPDGIHVILADTNQNIFEGELTKHYTVEFAGGEYACDVTQLYAGSSFNGDGVLVDAEGQEIETAGVKVKVKVPVESIDMSDDTENGDGVCGHIISLIYKGDHYHYVVRTKDDYDFHLHDEYLWNENDYVRLIIPKESIEMSLLGEN